MRGEGRADLAGSKVSMRPRRSRAPSGAPGSRSLRAVGSTGERPRRWSRISGSSIQLRRPEGVPMTEKITLSWSRLAGAENSSSSGERGKHERPGKRALRSCGGRLACHATRRQVGKGGRGRGRRAMRRERREQGGRRG